MHYDISVLSTYGNGIQMYDCDLTYLNNHKDKNKSNTRCYNTFTNL